MNNSDTSIKGSEAISVKKTSSKRTPLFVLACICTALALTVSAFGIALLVSTFPTPAESGAESDGSLPLGDMIGAAVVVFAYFMLMIFFAIAVFLIAGLGVLFSALSIRSSVKGIKITSIVLCTLNSLMMIPEIVLAIAAIVASVSMA